MMVPMIEIDTPQALMVCPFDECEHSNDEFVRELGKKLYVQVVFRDENDEFVEWKPEN